MKKQIVIIAGPGGVGKNVIYESIIAHSSHLFERIVSYTSRPIRTGEIAGETYHYISNAEFEKMIAKKEVFEHTRRYDYYRGMSKPIIDKILNSGKIAIKDADLVGVQALRKVYPGKVLAIFITADRDIVKQRLFLRGDTEKENATRLAGFDASMNDKKHFDFVVENNGTLDEAVKKVHSIITENI